MSKPIVVGGVLALAVALSLAVRTVREQNQQILGELSAIRRLLETSAAANDRVTLTNLTGEFLGKADAPLTMVEFTDLQCPYCREFHTTTFPQIKTEYIDTGKVRYISRDFPLDSLHPLAIAAARATGCAGDQGRWWEMRHAILVNNRALRPAAFGAFAQELRLNVDAFQQCVADTARVDGRWQQDKADGANAGVSGTPSFVIGFTSPNGLDGVRIAGAKPYDVFDAKFKELLRSRS